MSFLTTFSDEASKTYKDAARTATTGPINLLSAPASIGSVNLNLNDRVLVKDQLNAEENGIYLFKGAGSPMVRSTDANSDREVLPNMLISVSEGDYEDKIFELTTNGPISLGVTPLNFGLAILPIDLTTDVVGVLPVANGGTNKSSWTEGRVVFAEASGSALTEDSNLTWDNSNKRLGIGTSAPQSPLHVVGVAGNYVADLRAPVGVARLLSTTGTNSTQFHITNSAGTFYMGLDSSTGGNFGSAYSANLWHTGNYPLRFATNDTVKMTLTADGNLGIGTASPNAKVQINNSGTQVGLSVYSTSTNNALQFFNEGSTSYTAAFYNSADSAQTGASIGGYFSRGTLSARTQSLANDVLLSLTGSGYTGSAFAPSVSGGIVVAADQNTTAGGFGGQVSIVTTPNDTLGLPLPRLTVKNDGKVGIGTSAPSTLTHLYGTNPALTLQANSTTGTASINFGDTASANVANISYLNNGDSLTFTVGTERMRIDSAGNVGIGTAAPADRLHVVGTMPLIVSNSNTDAIAKSGRVATTHYTLAEEPLNLIGGTSEISENIVRVGGGYSAANASTQISFWNAENTTTVTGEETARIYRSSSVSTLRLRSTLNAGPDLLLSKIESFNGPTNRVNSAVNFLNGDLGFADWGQISFSTNYTGGLAERMRITSAGNVGINVTSPTQKLEVNGNILFTGGDGNSSNGNLRVIGSPNNQISRFEHYGTGTSFLSLRKARGTLASPTAANAGDWLGAVIGSGYDNVNEFRTSVRIRFVADEVFSPTASGGHIAFDTTPIGSTGVLATAERMRIDSAGNVGIGISSPIQPLHVAGTIRSSLNAGQWFEIRSSSATSGYGGWIDVTDNGIAFANNSNLRGFTFSNNTGEKMRIDSAGNVGIGTASPTEKLEIAGNAKAQGLLLQSRHNLTGAVTVLSNDYYVGCNSSGGAVTVALQAAATAKQGRKLVIKAESSLANVTINAAAGETIDGSASHVLNVSYESVTLVCNGANAWFIV